MCVKNVFFYYFKFLFFLLCCFKYFSFEKMKKISNFPRTLFLIEQNDPKPWHQLNQLFYRFSLRMERHSLSMWKCCFTKLMMMTVQTGCCYRKNWNVPLRSEKSSTFQFLKLRTMIAASITSSLSSLSSLFAERASRWLLIKFRISDEWSFFFYEERFLCDGKKVFIPTCWVQRFFYFILATFSFSHSFLFSTKKNIIKLLIYSSKIETNGGDVEKIFFGKFKAHKAGRSCVGCLTQQDPFWVKVLFCNVL